MDTLQVSYLLLLVGMKARATTLYAEAAGGESTETLKKG